MISKIKKKIGEMFGKKDLEVSKKAVVVKEAQKREVQKEEVKKEVVVNNKKEEQTKSFENRRRDGERNTRVRQDQNNRRKVGGAGERRYSDSKSGVKSYNKKDNYGKKNYSDRKSGDDFKKVLKEEKLSNWIEEGLRVLSEGETIQYEGHSIEIVKKNTLGVEVKLNDSKECKITFDELVTKLKGLKGAHDMEGKLSSEDSDETIVIRGIFQKY